MSNLPDYRLSAYNRLTKQRTDIGAGWKNEDGSISIKVGLMVTITAQDDIAIHLWPNDKSRTDWRAKGEQAAARPERPRPHSPFVSDADKDITF